MGNLNETAIVLTDIGRERHRQMLDLGFDRAHDDLHTGGELAMAAASYCLKASNQPGSTVYWPWEAVAFRPRSPREDLVRAAALIVAEIERLDRQTASNE